MDQRPCIINKPSFVICKVQGRYTMEKTLRALWRRIDNQTYRPHFPADIANYHFRELVLHGYDRNRYAFKWPQSIDEWQEIFGKIFTQANLSRGIITGRDPDTQRRFPAAVREKHHEMLNRNFLALRVAEDWLANNIDVLQQLIASLS
jgi:hypothetical protein